MMTTSERYLLEMTTRGPAFLEQGAAIFTQLKNIQQTLNICGYTLIMISVFLFLILIR